VGDPASGRAERRADGHAVGPQADSEPAPLSRAPVLEETDRLIPVGDEEVEVAVAIVVEGDEPAGVVGGVEVGASHGGEAPEPVVQEQHGRHLVDRGARAGHREHKLVEAGHRHQVEVAVVLDVEKLGAPAPGRVEDP